MGIETLLATHLLAIGTLALCADALLASKASIVAGSTMQRVVREHHAGAVALLLACWTRACPIGACLSPRTGVVALAAVQAIRQNIDTLPGAERSAVGAYAGGGLAHEPGSAGIAAAPTVEPV